MELAQLSEQRDKDMKAGSETMKKLQDAIEKLQIDKQVGNESCEALQRVSGCPLCGILAGSLDGSGSS